MSVLAVCINSLRHIDGHAVRGAVGLSQDWGDIAPEKGTHQQMNQLNHPAISLYDNAMLIIAMESFATLAAAAGEASTAAKWRTTVRETPFLSHV